MIRGRVEMVGRPEFWETAHDVNPAAFKAANELGVLFQKLRSKPVHGELPVALARIMTVTFNSFGAVTMLLLNGYDSDAMRVVRGMFENEVTAAYLRLHPVLVKDYNDFLYISIQQEIEFLQNKSPDLFAQVPPEHLENAKSEIAAIQDRFKTKKGHWKGSWTDVSVYQMAVDTGREEHYQTLYRWGSGLAHGDITSVVAAFNKESSMIDAHASTEWTRTALMAGHAAVLSVMKDFNDEARFGSEKEIEDAGSEYKAAWNSEISR